MSSRLAQRRARIHAEYGFDFPADFFRFWEFVNRLSPLDPLNALAEPLGIVLVGPFEVLAGRFDGRVTRHSLLLHWRYHDDPPEFFTVLAGGGDGLHWGYFLDDPDSGSGCIASYYAHEGYELSIDGDDLFQAVRLHLEFTHSDCQIDGAYSLDDPISAESNLQQLEKLRNQLMQYSTADRPQIGDAYTEQFAGVSQRNERIRVETLDQAGIVLPDVSYRPLSKSPREQRRALRKEQETLELIAEAQKALEDGFPGTALELGRNLWALGGRRRTALAVQLLEAAYPVLGRETLVRVLTTHMANRSLPSVDILEDEEQDPQSEKES